VSSTATKEARAARDSEPIGWLARFGFLGSGVVYAVLGLLALRVALGERARADRNGALAAIKVQPFGRVLLVVLAVSFAGYALWRLLDGAVGHRSDDEPKRTALRVGSFGRGVVYAVLAVSTARFVFSSPGGDKTEPLTARVMSHTGGRTLVGAVGAAVVAGGLAMAYRGARQKFLERLNLGSAGPAVTWAARVIGAIGLVGRGLVVALIGGFLVQAAVAFNPDKAQGLDASLKKLATAPFGRVLLAAAALGLLGFGAWSFVEARYRRLSSR
jgi:hypothetical protein